MKLQEIQILYPQLAVVDMQDPSYVNKLEWAFFFLPKQYCSTETAAMWPMRWPKLLVSATRSSF